jgi:hypothetical protein
LLHTNQTLPAKFLTALVTAAILVSCATPQQGLRTDIAIQTLNIYIEHSLLIPKQIQTGFDQELDGFISQYNRKPHKFKLQKVNIPQASTLIIKTHEMRLVTPDQQAVGAAVTAIGLSLPFIMVSAGSPFYIFFYYLPTVKTITETTLSDDINSSLANPAVRRYDTPGFLKSSDRQMEKHIELFDRYYLKRLLRELENSYKNRK